MAICEKCSFISYPDKWQSKEAIKEHYRKEYRQPPNSGNFYSGQRKIHFHAAFLDSVFRDWQGNKKAKPVIFESGAAYGLVLSWLKSMFPEGDISGSELTTSYRRVAHHELGVSLQEDFDPSKKYDLIMSYKVAEHQLDVDKELTAFQMALKDDGLLYISVPIWLDTLNNFGASGFDLGYYYDPNHINVWQKEHFEYLLAKCGFEIIKQDHVMYDSTYLCKKTAPSTKDFSGISPDETIEKLKKIKEAYMHFVEGDVNAALAAWPNFPMAHLSKMEGSRKECYEKGWEWTKENVIDVALKSCPYAAEPIGMAADMALRLKKYDVAVEYAKESLARRPNNPSAIFNLINCFRELAIHSKDPAEQARYFGEAKNLAVALGQVSAQHARESIDYTYLFASQLPLPNER